MSLLFSETVAAAMAGQNVRRDMLFELQFTSKTEYLRLGRGRVTAGGRIWQGLGDLARVSGLQLGPGLATKPCVLELSGVGELAQTRIRAQPFEVKNRPLIIRVMHFDENWQGLDNPVPVAFYAMDKMRKNFDFDANKWIIEVNCEPRSAGKHLAPNGYLSDNDQQARHPGDLVLQRAAIYAGGVTRRW